MFQRRKRNLDLTGTNGQSKREGSSHGISWETVQQRTIISESPYNEDVEIESGWEEGDEDSFSPAEKYQERHPPVGKPRLAFSERPNVKNVGSSQSEPSYPGLQKRPDFYEQHKKLTIYVEKELVETMERLKKERYIPSYSWLVSEAVKQYLAARK
ncbi:CopG family transcriptional regulator [Brevibacillus invocatus]|uniref:ribbon-helix-helix domain-containing protein n=1 Tax=Brevibacillus invocatus TaxID=173959 RepID=UPI00203C267F|nr:CopG family transcriptional regulator [Brevibacillus invocatus]MCM3081909.1 ribbon-helix-helix domain-containing protein [Brevibacillus invocatus]MCM3432315.1 ribbon-helix-helix domain-containing protein [Brevibacillus invocatus]